MKRPRSSIFSWPPRDLDEYQLRMELRGHVGPVSSLDFSHDNTLMVSGSLDTTLKLWEMNTELTSWPCVVTCSHQGAIHDVCFCANSELILGPEGQAAEADVGSMHRTVSGPATSQTTPNRPSQKSHKKSKSADRSSFWKRRPPTPPESNGKLSIGRASPTVFASASEDCTVKVWRLQPTRPGGQPDVRELKVLSHDGPVHAVVFSPCGERLASGSADKKIKIWDTATWNCIQELDLHDEQVFTLAFSPTGGLLVSGTGNGEVRDPRTQLQPLPMLATRHGRRFSLEFTFIRMSM